MKKRTRTLAAALTLAVLFSLISGTGMTAFAQESEPPVCAHEAGEHNEACGFSAGVECDHDCTDAPCGVDGASCGHSCEDSTCSYEAPADCGHTEHDETCGGPVTPQTEDDETEEPESPTETGTITGFELAEVKVAQGAPEAELGLPTEVVANVQPADADAQPTTATVGVGKWVTPLGMQAYDPANETLNIFVYEADPDSLTLPEGVSLPENVDMPCVRVVVGDAEMPEITPFANASALATTIRNYGLTATVSGSTVTVTGTKYNATTQLLLEIDAGVTVNWDATLTSGSNLTDGLVSLKSFNGTFNMNGGEIRCTTPSWGDTLYARGDTGTLNVNGGRIYGTSAAAIIFNVNSGGANGTLNVTGGEVHGTRAGISVQFGTLNVSGGFIKGEGTVQYEHAIIGQVNTVKISITGGVILSKNKTAVFSYGTSVTVTGGVVCGYNSATTGVVTSSGNQNVGPTSNGVVLAYSGTGTPSYNVGATTSIAKSPSGATANWQSYNNAACIYYSYGTNSGYVPIDEARINLATATVNDFTYTLPTDYVYNGSPQGVTVKDKLDETGSTTTGAITVYYTGTSGTTYARSTTAPTNAGTYTVAIRTAGGNKFAAVTADMTLGTYTIAQKDLVDLTGATAQNKAYDGTDTATVNVPLAAANGLVGSDDVSITVTATFADKDVAQDITVTATAWVLSGAKAGNYALPTLSDELDDLSADITPKALTITGVTATGRAYNASTTVNITGGALQGVVSPDVVTPEVPATGTIASANAGTGKTVTLAAITLTGADAGNYTLTQPTVTVDIAKATYSGTPGLERGVLPDTTTTMVVPLAELLPDVQPGTFGTVEYVYSGMQNDVSLLPNEAPKVNGAYMTVRINPRSNGSATIEITIRSDNYNDITATVTLSITSKTDVSGNITFADGNGTYNGTQQSHENATISGITPGGNAGWTYAYYIDANRGGDNESLGADGKPVNAGTYYVIATYEDDDNLGVKIVEYQVGRKTITGIRLIADNKEYDGTTTATATVAPFTTANGIVASDVGKVSLTSVTAAFSDKNAGTQITVTLTGGDFTGTAKGNYEPAIEELPITTTANITPKALTVTGATGLERAYNGTTVVMVGGTVHGRVGSDNLALVGSVTDPNAANGKPVTVTLGGTDAGNYSFTAPTGVTVNITKAAAPTGGTINQSVLADKGAVISLAGVLPDVSPLSLGTVSYAYTSMINTDNIVDGTPAVNGGSLVASIKNEPTGTATITVTVTSQNYNDFAGTVVLTIEPKTDVSGSITFTAANGTYNGQQHTREGATVSVSGGNPKWTYAYALGDSPTGSERFGPDGKPVGAGNYKVVATYEDDNNLGSATATFTITPKTITITGVSATGREYDGTLNVTLAGGTLQGVVNGDAVTFTLGAGTLAEANAGTGKQVSTSIALGGADAGNYTLTQPTGITADITKKSVTISGISATDRPYNGTTEVVLTGGSLTNVLPADAANVGFALGAGTVDSANVGTGKSVSTSITLTGTAANNYTLTQPTGITVDITKATTAGQPQTMGAVYGYAHTYSYDLRLLLPSLAAPAQLGTPTYTVGVVSDADSIFSAQPTTASITGNTIALDIAAVADTQVGDTATVTIKVSSANYDDFTVVLTVEITDKTSLVPTFTASGGVYGNSAYAISGVTFPKADGTGNVTLAASQYSISYSGTTAGGGTYGPTATAPKDAGSYTVTVAVNSSDVLYMGQTVKSFTISQRAITLTAKDVEVNVGGTMPTIWLYTVSGLAPGETVTDAIATAPTAGCTAVDTSTAGSWVISLTGGTATDNYTIASLVNGTFTVLEDYHYIDDSGNYLDSLPKHTDKAATYTARLNGDYSKFFDGTQVVGRVLIDGVELTPGTHFTHAEGSTILTFKASYMATLANGTHTMTVYFSDGKAELPFIVAYADTKPDEPSSDPSGNAEDSSSATGAANSPQTGDDSNMGLWVVLLFLSGGALGGGLLLMRKRRRTDSTQP